MTVAWSDNSSRANPCQTPKPSMSIDLIFMPRSFARRQPSSVVRIAGKGKQAGTLVLRVALSCAQKLSPRKSCLADQFAIFLVRPRAKSAQCGPVVLGNLVFQHQFARLNH